MSSRILRFKKISSCGFTTNCTNLETVCDHTSILSPSSHYPGIWSTNAAPQFYKCLLYSFKLKAWLALSDLESAPIFWVGLFKSIIFKTLFNPNG